MHVTLLGECTSKQLWIDPVSHEAFENLEEKYQHHDDDIIYNDDVGL